MATGMAIPGKGQIVVDYLRKYKSASSYQIAELLLRDYPAEFTSLEQARTRVRYYRGSQGDEKRKKIDPENYVPKFVAPKSDEKNHEPYVIPDDAYPIIAFGDVHLPYHSPDALEIMVDYAVKIGAKTLLMMGDIMDCYQVSRWERDPRNRSIAGEIEIFGDFVDSLKAALPDSKIIYKFGNHEARFEKYLMNNAPALFGVEEIRLHKLLKLEEKGIDYVDCMRIVRYKHLNMIHGSEYVFSINNPVNAARGLYLKAKKSAMTFHHHRSSDHTETAITGETVTCWSVGCLCDLKPEYMPLNSWQHGFAEINGDDDMFQVRNHRIIDYKVV